MIFRSFLLGSVVALLAGCPDAGMDDVAAARAFFAQPTTEQMRTFRQHPLSEQLDLYFYGNQRRHPPAIYLARCFALSGVKGVEMLRSKLQSKNDDLTVRDISALLSAIDSLGRYDVSKDASVMSALRSQVATMQDAGWRDTAEKEIADIEHSEVAKPGNAPECGENQ